MTTGAEGLGEAGRGLQEPGVNLVTTASRDKALDVLLQGRPPKPLVEPFTGLSESQVTGNLGGMVPIQDLDAEISWDKETVFRAGAKTQLDLPAGPRRPLCLLLSPPL